MKMRFIIITILIFVFSSINAQRIGLVLSGGGAKGIAHIGIIKALEENGIPIDYITGTSMGAIVGGMYAMGYSPDEMIQIVKSKDFKRWTTGEIETNYKYYYRNVDPKPSFIEIPFSLNALDSISLTSSLLPTNIVSPRQMNYAFLPLTAQANAVCKGDFDKLFVPFRCVASDIYNKESVVFRYGEMGDAIRASMTYPFMFKPLTINGRLLFDGGIFNNFPVDVMMKDFHPDFTIGSVVANNPRKPDERDILMQIQNMIMSKTDYNIPKRQGIMLRFRATNIKLFDFSKVDELVKMGYDSTMKHMNEIKQRVANRVSSTQQIVARRAAFKSRFPELKFQRVIVEGVDSLQKRYIEQVFHYQNDVFTLKEFKDAYFKLISDEKILEVLPHAIYNSATGNFDLKLNVKIQDHLKLLFGGNISATSSNQAYFGLTYQNISEFAQTAYLDAQFGKLYNGISLGTRIEIPAQKSWYAKLNFVLHKLRYYESDQLFYNDIRPASFSQSEFYGKFSVGFPIKMKSRVEMGLGYGILTDTYSQNQTSITLAKHMDKSIMNVGSTFLKLESSTLNDRMYPTSGCGYFVGAQVFAGEETFHSGLDASLNIPETTDYWAQSHVKYDNYIPINSKFTLGTYGELMFSTRKLLQNYTLSLIQAPYFQPTPYTKTVYNESFAANSFGAIGLKPIYQLTKELHLRGEAYWFVPYQTIMRANDNSAYLSAPFKSSQFMAESTLVFNFKLASIGMYVNYFSTAPSKWNFGVNIGYLLFNPKFTD